jgi:hypothetical protein
MASTETPTPIDSPPATAAQASNGPALLDADGCDRPGFVLDFPADPELQRLVQAFERGDFATVRREAPKLAAAASNAEVRAAALELRRRISPDPLVVWFLAGSVALFSFLVIWSYWLHQP